MPVTANCPSSFCSVFEASRARHRPAAAINAMISALE
jgi:hypothetical protein